MFAREVVSACDDDEQLQQLREAEKTAPRPGVDFASRITMATLFCCPSIAYHNVLVVVQGRATGQTASRPRSPSVRLPPNMDQPGHLLAGALHERALPIAAHPYHTSLTFSTEQPGPQAAHLCWQENPSLGSAQGHVAPAAHCHLPLAVTRSSRLPKTARAPHAARTQLGTPRPGRPQAT